MIIFSVQGIPEPAGSKRSWVPRDKDGKPYFRKNGGGIVVNTVDANPKAKSWKQEVASAAAEAMQNQPLLQGPLRLAVSFIMPRPKGHYGTGKNEGVLKPRVPTFHTVKPDVTKLVRAIEDALTGVCWRDDSQITTAEQTKRYGDRASVVVRIEELRESFELPAPLWGSSVGSTY